LNTEILALLDKWNKSKTRLKIINFREMHNTHQQKMQNCQCARFRSEGEILMQWYEGIIDKLDKTVWANLAPEDSLMLDIDI